LYLAIAESGGNKEEMSSISTQQRIERLTDDIVSHLELFDGLIKFLLAKHPEVLEEWKQELVKSK
jgi:hypothetical protein